MAKTTIEQRYLFTDHLGSLDVITNAQATVTERFSFDAHGNRRAPDWQTALLVYPAPGQSFVTKRGFTNHEHIDEMSVVHMNGRIYDPRLGRFLQADPVNQDPTNSQSFNRYSYVLNNPMTLTDPTGLFSIGKYWRQIVSLAITIAAPWAIGATLGFWGSVAVGFVSGAIGSGSLQGGLIGAFSAGLFFGIGTAFEGVRSTSGGVFGSGFSAGEYAMKTLAHGIAGGAMSSLQGGKFGNGFISAGITQFASGKIDSIDSGNAGFSAMRTVVAAMVGGTVSAATGGKFANGAVTGAFSRAFNDEANHQRATESGGYSPVAGVYLDSNGQMVNISIGTRGNLVDPDGNFYSFNYQTEMVHRLDMGAVESSHPEALLGGLGAIRVVSIAGYKTIAWATSRAAPTYSNFAIGSIARTAFKAALLSPRWVKGGLFVHPRVYWAKAGGDFNRAVVSLNRPNARYDSIFVPLAPLSSGFLAND